MENKTLLQKIRSVKYCLMAHPHNEPDSEFADRIDDLQEIEDSLESPPTIQTVDEAAETEDVNLLKRRLEFYRNETSKIRDYVFDDANKCGYPTQSIFEAITDKIDALKAEIAEHQARQPARKTLDEVKDEVANDYSCESFDQLLWRMADGEDMDGYKNILDEVAELYAQAKAVGPQQGWVDVKTFQKLLELERVGYTNCGTCSNCNGYSCSLVSFPDLLKALGIEMKYLSWFNNPNRDKLPEPPTQTNN